MAREISNVNFQLQEDLPNNFVKAVQFFTFLDLVSDGAEIEGFSTPSKNNVVIPTSLLSPSTANSPELVSDDERNYIELAQQDIFLDGRAIRDLGGSENIPKTALAIRTGSPNQQIMTGVNEFKIAGNLSAAKVLNNGNPEANKVTGTIDAGVDINSTPRAVIITLQWPSLRQLSADDGSSVGLGINSGTFKGDSGSVHVVLRIRNKNGTTIDSQDRFLNKISVGQYSKDYRMEIPFSLFQDSTAISNNYPLSIDVLRGDQEFRASGGRHPFDEKGTNVYEEGTRRFTEFFFSGLQGAIPQITTVTEFPKTAYIGLRYSAEQFPNIPQRRYFIRGIKVKVPTGSNDGTVPIDSDNGRILYPTDYSFDSLNNTEGKKRWTTDPAWILYALLTQDYGLQISEDKIDKSSFYAASVYCSTPVTGQDTPRYSFNGVLNQRKKALDVIKEVAGLMRASLYYKNGSIKLAIDKPETITSYLFTNANVVNGSFNYSGNDKDKKFTQINVSYFNNQIQELDQISVSVEQLDPSLQDKYGLNQTNIQAIYTTDRKQATRLGRSILYSGFLEAEVITFECGIEAAAILEPFMIIKVADRIKETFRSSGRINSVTSPTIVVVDDSTDTTVGSVGDSFLIIDKEGGVQEKTIEAVSGSTVTLTSALSPEPQAGTIWATKTGNVQHRKFRVSNIKQKDNFVFTISAISYDENKYTFIDDDSSDFGKGDDPSTLLDTLDAPQIQELKEELIVVNGRATSRIVLNFSSVAGARNYQVSYKLDGAEPVVRNIFTTQFTLLNNPVGSYEFSVKSINIAHIVSELPSQRTILAEGLSAKPSAVANLRAEESGDDLILKFDRATDKDVLFGGFVDVELSLITDGTATLQNANPEKRVDGNINEIVFNDYQSGEYFLKFIDVNGNKSETATSVVVNRTITSNNLVGAQIRENTNNFAGAKVNVVYDSGIGGLRLTSGTTIDTLTDFNTLALADGTTFASIDLVTAGVSTTGNYTFQNTFNLGSPFRFHIEPHFKKSGFDTATLWDSYTDNMNDWPDIFTTSTTVLDRSAELTFQVAKSQTGTASTSFETFGNTDVIAQTVSFKVLVNNLSTYENIDIEELGANIIFRPRTERSIDNSSATNGVLTSSGSGATTVTFNKKFFTGTTAIGGSTTAFNPVVFININNMIDGDFFTIDSVTSSQFVVSIKNVSSFVSRSFTYSAFGYGEG